jgi:beta-glucanase (GH16 family)
MGLKCKAVPIATVMLGALAMHASAAENKAAAPAIFFDDFSYADDAALASNGWIVRDKAGLPGIGGARWGAGSLQLIDDPHKASNRLARMTAHTDGTGANTQQAQLCHQRKYLEGTYAARVRFSDEPASGPDGDGVVQSFYVISPLKFGFDPEYSELDFEYLPNGGWDEPRTRLYATSWQTVQLEPWDAHRQFHQDFQSSKGWHTLVFQVADNNIHYFVDGKPFAHHGGRVYPAVPMSINFNLWFINQGTLPGNRTPREYQQDIDWVFHAKGKVLSPQQVEAEVRKLRKQGKAHVDTVPAAQPPLPSSCDF